MSLCVLPTISEYMKSENSAEIRYAKEIALEHKINKAPYIVPLGCG